MIQAEQLRQGNKLKFEDDVVTVLWITPGGVIIDGIDAADGSNIILEPERLDYIQLDEEWLERCGFEKVNSNVPGLMLMPSFDSQRQFRWDRIDGFSIQSVHSGFRWELSNILFVHKLQNLFYVLTGRELEIKQEAWRTL